MIHLIAMTAAAALLAAGGALAAETAAPRVQDFAWAAPITAEGQEGLYVAELPFAVYAGSKRHGLADLRVYNGAEEIVPHALRSVATPDPRKREGSAVPIFPVWANPGIEIGAVSVRVRQGPNGAIIDVRSDSRGKSPKRISGYLVDMSALKERVQSLEFDWREPADGFVGRVRIEKSDDLARWSFAGEGPLVSLHHAGHILAQKRVGLAPLAAKYLRISWPASQEMPELTGVRVVPVDLPVDTPRARRTVEAAAGGKPGEYLFDLGANAPFDRLQLELPNPNTVAPVQFLARASETDTWRLIASATVYRIAQAGQTIASEDITIRPTPERYWMVRADPASGGLGNGAPKLTAEFVPQQILFAARGAGPFVLAFGSATVGSAALPVATLVPGYRDDKPLEAARATIGAAQAQARAPSAWPAWLELGPGDWKKLALWGVLAAGVLLLAWMAWRLSARMGTASSSGSAAPGANPRE